MTALILNRPAYSAPRQIDREYAARLLTNLAEEWATIIPDNDDNARTVFAMSYTPQVLADKYEDTKNVLQAWHHNGDISHQQRPDTLSNIATTYRTLVGISIRYKSQQKRTGYAWKEF